MVASSSRDHAEFAETIGDLAHRDVHDVRHAGDAQLPVLADVKQRQRLAAATASNEFGGGDFGNGHDDYSCEEPGWGPKGYRIRTRTPTAVAR